MISSTSNKKIKDVCMLCKKASLRKERGLFVVEGIKMFEEINPSWIVEAYVSESFANAADSKLKAKLAGIGAELVTDTVYEYMSDTKSPQGILAVVKMKEYSLEDVKGGLIVILERLQDPGNLGTIMRTAEAAGVSCVIMDRETVDIYNPKTVRSTMGAVFRVPFIYTDDLMKMTATVKKDGYRIYAAHLKGTKFFNEINYGNKTAFLIGNESAGLSDDFAALADEYVKIPMKGNVESLNASVAASLLMYEYSRYVKD